MLMSRNVTIERFNMHVKPYINDLGEINWGDLPEDWSAEMRRTGLASFD